jgi:serine/threonine protein kinase
MIWQQKIFDNSELGLSKPFSFSDLESIQLPRLTFQNKIQLSSGEIRAHLIPTHRVGSGGHGILEEFYRVQTNQQELILLKKSKDDELSVRTEAFVQWLAQKTFEVYGLGNRIPQVYDILLCTDNNVGFTMKEFTNCFLCSKFILESTNVERDIYHILGQVSILLQILEETLHLDHRDLKANNILISPEPSILSFSCLNNGAVVRTQFLSPFTVILVDFGFACIGNVLTGLTSVDAGEGAFPPLDPCPKEGRDIFQFIASLYSVESLRAKLTPSLAQKFSDWLDLEHTDCQGIIKKWSYTELMYLLTSLKTFKKVLCTPKAILEEVRKFDPSAFLTI